LNVAALISTPEPENRAGSVSLFEVTEKRERGTGGDGEVGSGKWEVGEWGEGSRENK
jgi:hypothetical protein